MIRDIPGGPETPFSDLGLKTYQSYWKRRVASTLKDLEEDHREISIHEIQKRTGMTYDDIQYTLEYTQILRYINTQPTLNCDPLYLKELIDSTGLEEPRRVYKDKIRWFPQKLTS